MYKFIEANTYSALQELRSLLWAESAGTQKPAIVKIEELG
jgi:hypothetical protein